MHERRKTSQTRNLRRRRRGRLCELNIRLVGHCWTQSFQVTGEKLVFRIALTSARVLVTAVAEAAGDRIAARWPGHFEQDDYVLCKVFISVMYCDV